MATTLMNVLFLCTGNTARSVLAEGILRRDGAGRYRAFSAGSQPKGVVNPFALSTLAAHGYPHEGYRSKSWDELAVPGAPKMDFIFTVCDSASGETCPVWPGHPTTAHWGIDDPAGVGTTADEKIAAFETAFTHLHARISAFLALPVATLGADSLRTALRAIGRGHGATALSQSLT
jgi:arsenate reductase (thioredoxin)